MEQLPTKLLAVAKNRMKEHLDAAQRQRSSGTVPAATGRWNFGDALAEYRRRLQSTPARPNTRAFREAGIKLLLRSLDGIESLNVSRITSPAVENWQQRFRM